jgi:hypothetical protein
MVDVQRCPIEKLLGQDNGECFRYYVDRSQISVSRYHVSGCKIFSTQLTEYIKIDSCTHCKAIQEA